MSVKNGTLTTTKAGRKLKKTKRFVSSDSPTLDANMHKHNKVLQLLPSYKGVTTFTDRHITSPNKNRTFNHSKQKNNAKRVQIKEHSLRHDNDKGPSERDIILSSPTAKDMKTADDSNTSVLQMELQARPLHNPPGPPSDGTPITTHSGEMDINTQAIAGFSYTDLLGETENTDSNENSLAPPSSPTPNENGIWGQRPKLDLNVLTPKDMALLTVKAFGREDITDYLLEVHLLLLSLFHA
jgi:hypothetical protein